MDETAARLAMVQHQIAGRGIRNERVLAAMRDVPRHLFVPLRPGQLGDVVAHQLPVVVAEEFGDDDVIGMNFLSRLRAWRVEGRTLILEPVTQ